MENNQYKVKINGNIYTLYSSENLQKGKQVTIVIPSGNWNGMYIDNSSDSLINYKNVYNTDIPPRLIQKQKLEISQAEINYNDITVVNKTNQPIYAGKIFMDNISGTEEQVDDEQESTLPCINMSFPPNVMFDGSTDLISALNAVKHPTNIALADLDNDNIAEDVTITWSGATSQHFSLTINSNEEVTAINWDDGTTTTVTRS
ncbi:MAG TPA: hypothetical protein PLZ29_06995 [Spirochaetota bacterium]|nr:hypothetical protein [Spirochaetota bacterium]